MFQPLLYHQHAVGMPPIPEMELPLLQIHFLACAGEMTDMLFQQQPKAQPGALLLILDRYVLRRAQDTITIIVLFRLYELAEKGSK